MEPLRNGIIRMRDAIARAGLCCRAHRLWQVLRISVESIDIDVDIIAIMLITVTTMMVIIIMVVVVIMVVMIVVVVYAAEQRIGGETRPDYNQNL